MARHSSRWSNLGGVALLFAGASFGRLVDGASLLASLRARFPISTLPCMAIEWRVRGALPPYLTAFTALRDECDLTFARPRTPRMTDSPRQLRLEEPLPKSNRPLTPHVALQAPPLRFHPKGSFRPVRLSGLRRRLRGLLDLLSQNRPAAPP